MEASVKVEATISVQYQPGNTNVEGSPMRNALVKSVAVENVRKQVVRGCRVIAVADLRNGYDKG